jgi:peptidyl-Lys metalloendopeptidase
MWRVWAVLGVVVLAGGAEAATFERCTKAQIATARAAIRDAHALAGDAARAVSDSPAYARWFGRWNEGRAATVRETLQAIGAALASDGLHVVCPPPGPGECPLTIIAWVMPDETLEVNLCPSFFTMPGVRGVVATSHVFETGTREGTIIHEVSHFDLVAATGDHCYGRTDCGDMARRDPDLAVRNADSLQYFAEDIALAQRVE